jgi:hypothetical protein
MSENTESVTINNTTSETDVDNVEIPAPVVNNTEEREDVEVIEDVAKNPKKQVSFLLDVESKAIIETLVDTLEGFSLDNIITLVPRLIQHVENYKNLSGENKKNLVIKMLNHIIDVTDCPGDDDILDPIMKRMVPPLIDTLIEVNSGQLKLKKKPSFMKCILGCMSKSS